MEFLKLTVERMNSKLMRDFPFRKSPKNTKSIDELIQLISQYFCQHFNQLPSHDSCLVELKTHFLKLFNLEKSRFTGLKSICDQFLTSLNHLFLHFLCLCYHRLLYDCIGLIHVFLEKTTGRQLCQSIYTLFRSEFCHTV